MSMVQVTSVYVRNMAFPDISTSMRYNVRTENSKTKMRDAHQNTALTAVALQDHMMKSLSLGDPLRPKRLPLGCTTRSRRKAPKPVVDTGRYRPLKKVPSDVKSAADGVQKKEYVLDSKPAPLTLAQRYGLVEAPAKQLTEAEWGMVKEKSNRREDSKQPCVICKEEFGTQDQVLLSCTHVFHRACLQAFERFTGKKTCPMCRKEEYQTRVIHEGAKHHREICASRIQAVWRGYVVRCWYKKLRETVPPKDPALRKKFYEEKLHKITDRMVRSLDVDVNSFFLGLDRDLEASRNVFKHFDDMMRGLTEDDWFQIQLKAVARGNSECPICLTALTDAGLMPESTTTQDTSCYRDTGRPSPHSKPASAKQLSLNVSGSVGASSKQGSSRKPASKAGSSCEKTYADTHRESVLLSCSHVFHKTCLEAFEEFSAFERQAVCPVCRAHYQKKVV